MFNKTKKISSLTTAIIIMLISSSFLPLNDGHTLASFLLSAEPVFAQPFGQDDIIPYGAEQEVPTIPSAPSSPAMDFSMFMDSFANSIFNATSTFAGVGTSIVDGVEVSGINFDKSQNQLSITLSRSAIQEQGSNNNITSTDTTIAASSIPSSNSVSVIAMRIPISMSDILSMAAASSSSSSSLNALDGGVGDSTTENQVSSFSSSDTFNPFSLLSSLQIGSSTLTDVDWSEPQTVTMNLVGNDSRTNQEQQLNSLSGTRADFVLVSVIPHTGVSNNTISSTIP
jgi:hypothetical protein